MASSGQLNIRERVRDANLRFYEAVAGVYDKVDSRRADGQAHPWLNRLLAELRSRVSAPSPSFLDLGAGTAFLSRAALAHFPEVTAVDLSPAVLAQIPEANIRKVCAPCEELPFPQDHFDVVGAFATLHHLYDPRELVREAHRVLKPGGLLYTDHDIERSFVRRFRWPLRAYRAFFDHGPRYLAACPNLTAEDYELSEFHGENVVDSAALRATLAECGFTDVQLTFHWEGLLPVTPPWRAHGYSPLLRIVARK